MGTIKARSKGGICSLFALFSLWSVGGVWAEEDGHLAFLAYGTLGYSHDDSASIAGLRDLSQRPKKGPHTNDSWVMDSRLGLQATYQHNTYLDAMVQAVLREQAGSSFNSYLDWAFINLHPTPAFDVRLGRVGYDVFLMSDHRHLGYAYPWVRPPVEFYGWIPIYAIDGGDITYSLADGSARWRFKAQAGHAGLKFPMGETFDYDFKSDDVWSVSIAWEDAAWRVKGGYSQIIPKTDAPVLAPLQAGLDAVNRAGIPGVSAEAASLRKELSYKDANLHYATLGIAYDDGTWLAQTELGRVTTSADMVSNGNMAYVGIGRRLGDFTPFVLFSGVRSNAPVRKPSLNWAPFGLANLQTSAVFALNSTRFDQETESLGLRWDFNSHAALKIQMDSTNIHARGSGLWYQTDSEALKAEDRRVTLQSITIDFIF